MKNQTKLTQQGTLMTLLPSLIHEYKNIVLDSFLSPFYTVTYFEKADDAFSRFCKLRCSVFIWCSAILFLRRPAFYLKLYISLLQKWFTYLDDWLAIQVKYSLSNGRRRIDCHCQYLFVGRAIRCISSATH